MSETPGWRKYSPLAADARNRPTRDEGLTDKAPFATVTLRLFSLDPKNVEIQLGVDTPQANEELRRKILLVARDALADAENYTYD